MRQGFVPSMTTGLSPCNEPRRGRPYLHRFPVLPSMTNMNVMELACSVQRGRYVLTYLISLLLICDTQAAIVHLAGLQHRDLVRLHGGRRPAPSLLAR
jgi:hypothetical protein